MSGNTKTSGLPLQACDSVETGVTCATYFFSIERNVAIFDRSSGVLSSAVSGGGTIDASVETAETAGEGCSADEPDEEVAIAIDKCSCS